LGQGKKQLLLPLLHIPSLTFSGKIASPPCFAPKHDGGHHTFAYYLYPSSPRLSKAYSCVGAVHGKELILNIELLQSPLIYESIFHPQRQRHGQTNREVQLEELRKFWGFACRDGCNVGRRCTSVS
jgi:hypothetical protein